MADKGELRERLFEQGYTFRDSPLGVDAYFDEEHERSDLLSAGQHSGYLIVGITTFDRDSEFLGKVHFAKAHSVDIAGVNITQVED